MKKEKVRKNISGLFIFFSIVVSLIFVTKTFTRSVYASGCGWDTASGQCKKTGIGCTGTCEGTDPYNCSCQAPDFGGGKGCSGPNDCPKGYQCTQGECIPNSGGGGGGVTTGKCSCTAAYGACGNYFGYTNIKYRACTANSAGAFTCLIVNGVYYNYVSCAGGTTVPIATPTPTTPASTAVQNCGVCSSNAGKSTCFVRWTDPNGGCDSDFSNNRVEDCNAATSHCPVVAPTTSPLNCNVCSTLPGKANCRVRWIDPVGGCDSNFNNNRIEDCSASSGCPATSVSTTPVPTSGNPACICNSANTCDTSCTFDKFSDVTSYGNPVKCSLDPNVLASTPTSDQKNGWCKANLRTKGDVDGSGIINNFDYFYYVAAVNGGKIPASANADVDGDGLISTLDRAIIIRSQPTN